VSDKWEEKSYSSEVLIVDMALLQCALDLFLNFLGNLVKAVDAFVIVLGLLPPVVDDRRRHTAPENQVSREQQ